MSKNSIVVNQQRCQKCTLCFQDCPSSVLAADKDGFPMMAYPENCLNCGHCMAVCPFAALALNGRNPDTLPPRGRMPQYDEVKALLQIRRSHRRFQTKNIDAAILSDMLDALRYVPTGHNFRKLHYTVIDDIAVLAELRKYVHEKLLQWCRQAAEVPAPLLSTVRDIREGKDPIFRTAPHLLVVSHHKDAPTGLVDSVIALTQFEMLAQSRNLGTVWFGRILSIMKYAMPELPELLQIPADYQIGYAMLFGATRCHYPRGVNAPSVACRILKKIEPPMER